MVDSINLSAYLNGASLNTDSPIFITDPNYLDSHNYYDSQDMLSPNYGHHDCTILYPIYNVNCKHRTTTLPKYNKCYASL